VGAGYDTVYSDSEMFVFLEEDAVGRGGLVLSLMIIGNVGRCWSSEGCYGFV
jgi:hypothetical protein